MCQDGHSNFLSITASPKIKPHMIAMALEWTIQWLSLATDCWFNIKNMNYMIKFHHHVKLRIKYQIRHINRSHPLLEGAAKFALAVVPEDTRIALRIDKLDKKPIPVGLDWWRLTTGRYGQSRFIYVYPFFENKVPVFQWYNDHKDQEDSYIIMPHYDDESTTKKYMRSVQ